MLGTKGLMSILSLFPALIGTSYSGYGVKSIDTRSPSYTKKGPGRVHCTKLSQRTKLDEHTKFAGRVGSKLYRKAVNHKVGINNGLTFFGRYGDRR